MLFQARRIRDELIKRGIFHNISDQIASSQEIIDALTNCIDELNEPVIEVPF